jgi:lysophospholipase
MFTRSLQSADGTSLRVDGYPSDVAEPRGVVVLIHGFAEHRRRYGHVAAHLNKHGYHVLAGDLRGHGESGGDRGYIERFGDYVDDVTAFIADAQRSFPGGEARPPILLGHSMGGLVCLEYVLSHPKAVRALAITSPFFGIKIKVPGWKRTIGMAASVLHPRLKLTNQIDSSILSHDQASCKAYAADPLIFHTATARWFTEILATHGDVRRRARQLAIPMLLLQAGDDRLVDAQAAQELFGLVGNVDKQLKVYPGLFHEILNEVERDQVMTDLTDWLHKH